MRFGIHRLGRRHGRGEGHGHRRHRLREHLADGLRLCDVMPGERCRILEIGGGEYFRVRLMEMGLTPGEIIEVDKLAPLQDPMELIIRRYHLSLRRHDAAKIAVERV